MDAFAELRGINLHYLDRAGGRPFLVMLPGLTANAHCFDGLIGKGLSPRFRTLALDLRGRGLSDKPARGYSMAEHAADVIALLDHLDIGQAAVAGHSFGGLVTLYLAAHYRERVTQLMLLDSSGQIINSQSRSLIKPSLDRLGKVFDSWDTYIATMKKAPFFNGWWDAQIESYFRADVETMPDGTVLPRSRRDNIAEAVNRAESEDWSRHMAAIKQPCLLIRAASGFDADGKTPVVPIEQAMATAGALTECRYAEVPGNHMTMLYGESARLIVAEIEAFL